MKFEIEGKVVVVFEEKQISDRFTKREFVLEVDDGRYSQTVLFESSGRALEDLKDVKQGDEIRVHFNVRGREWRNPEGVVKYFNSLHAWKVERFGTSKPAPAPEPTPSAGGYENAPPIDDSDIPFVSCDLAHEPSPVARCIR